MDERANKILGQMQRELNRELAEKAVTWLAGRHRSSWDERRRTATHICLDCEEGTRIPEKHRGHRVIEKRG